MSTDNASTVSATSSTDNASEKRSIGPPKPSLSSDSTSAVAVGPRRPQSVHVGPSHPRNSESKDISEPNEAVERHVGPPAPRRRSIESAAAVDTGKNTSESSDKVGEKRKSKSDVAYAKVRVGTGRLKFKSKKRAEEQDTQSKKSKLQTFEQALVCWNNVCH